MNKIVIAGTCPKSEKTALANELKSLLPNSIKVVINQDTSNLDSKGPDCLIRFSSDISEPDTTGTPGIDDILKGSRISETTINTISKKFDLTTKTVRKLLWLSGARPEAASAIILVGGNSSRMGKDKALLEIDGEKAVNRLHKLLSPYFDEIMLSTSPHSDYTLPGIKIVKDAKKGHGPLMGIFSSLMESNSAINFFIACDIPEVNMPLIFKLLSNSEGYDISLPSFGEGRFEPLYGIYKKNVLSVVKKKLNSGKRRIASIFEECKTVILAEEGDTWYTNLNTPDDYKKYLSSFTKDKNI